MIRKALWHEAGPELAAYRDSPTFRVIVKSGRFMWMRQMEGTMTSSVSKVLLAFAATAFVLAATPTSAAVWVCTAKNARAANYTASAFGVFSQVVKDRARAKALSACAANSLVPATCYIKACNKTG